jgi:hypothetical protein
VEGARIAVAVPVSRGNANGGCTAGEHNTHLHHHDDGFVDAGDTVQQSFVYSVLPAARPAANTDHACSGDDDDDGALHDDCDNDLNSVDEHTFEPIAFSVGVLQQARPPADGNDNFGGN